MIIKMAMIVDINRPRSQELEGRILRRKALKLDTKKYADFENCKGIDIIKDEEEKRDLISYILISGTPVEVVLPMTLLPPVPPVPHQAQLPKLRPSYF
jgi:hypothetical protein